MEWNTTMSVLRQFSLKRWHRIYTIQKHKICLLVKPTCRGRYNFERRANLRKHSPTLRMVQKPCADDENGQRKLSPCAEIGPPQILEKSRSPGTERVMEHDQLDNKQGLEILNERVHNTEVPSITNPLSKTFNLARSFQGIHKTRQT